MSIPAGASWTPIDVDVDPYVIIGRMLDGLQAALGTGWTARESAPEVALAEELAPEVAASNLALQQRFDLAVALGVGTQIDGLPVLPGARATMAAQLVVTAVGTTVPAGTTVTVTNPAGSDVAFTTTTTVVAAATTVPVTLTARDLGAAANGAGAVPPATAALRIVNLPPGLVEVDSLGIASGGADPETLPAYLQRLRDYRTSLRPGGVRATDLAPLVRSVNGMQRALAIDLLDVTITGSDPQTNPAPRTVSVFPLDSAGGDPPAATLAAVQAAIAAVREVNFIVRIGTPTRTAVSVTFAAIARTGYTTSAVQAAITAALRAYLSPARWGGTPRTDGSLPTDWTETRTVRYLDLVRTAYVDGVASITSLQLNGATADVTLPGPAALVATSSTISGTVS